MLEYGTALLILVGIYVILCTSYNLVLGYAGLFSVAHAAFYGIGAYTAAILTTQFGVHFALAALAGVVLAGLVSVIVGLPSLRVSGEYLIVASFGLQMILSSIFRNWKSVTHGVSGIPGIPRPSIFGYTLADQTSVLGLILVVALVCTGVVYLLVHSPYGRLLRAVRDDPIAAASLGKHVVWAKVSVFVAAGALAAIAGALYAYYITFVSPESFDINASILILTGVIIGGTATFWGPVLGAAIIILLPEALRFLDIPNELVGALRQSLYGLLLVVFMMLRPEGIIPEHRRRDTPAAPARVAAVEAENT